MKRAYRALALVLAILAVVAVPTIPSAVAAEATPPAAASPPPTDVSVHQLLTVMQSRKMVDAMFAQSDGMMRRSMEAAMGGQTPNPEQQKILDGMRAKVVSLLKAEMQWETLEPTFLEVYRRTFTQQEVDGMIAFYGSRIGQSVVSKMPLAVQQSTQIMQEKMKVLLPKIQELVKNTIVQLKAAEAK